MKELEQQIKEFYNSESLSIEQLELIKRQSENKNNRLISYPSLLKYAAILVAAAAGVVLYSVFFIPIQQQNSIVNSFAEEIAFNHQKQLSSEYVTSSILELDTKMDKLDFVLSLPLIITNDFDLKGGRYCSVDKRIAAQLKLENNEGEIVTCYVFRKKESFDFNKTIIYVNTEVAIWDNGTLIFALASDN